VLVSRGNLRQQELIEQLKTMYKLCKLCSLRQGISPSKRRQLKPYYQECYICHGLMNELDSIKRKIMISIDGKYEFDTFLIGASLPTQIYEREDELRSKFKIHGSENVKSQLTRMLRIAFAKSSRTKIDYLLPDIIINLSFEERHEMKIVIDARPLIFAGTYIKKCRGIQQRQARCNKCTGRGCNFCGKSGLSGYDSVEGIIAKALMSTTKGSNPKFCWIGSEDRQSLVLGRGRPFFVRISQPKVRKLKDDLKIDYECLSAIITYKPMKAMPVYPLKFITKTTILTSCDKLLSQSEYRKLDALAGSTIIFSANSKKSTKRIYSAGVTEVAPNKFRLTITADGGLAIKQFIEGREYMKPNVSEIVGANCQCLLFDVLDLWIEKEFLN
jgi:tRNA pseudouridine synthase 10